MRYARGLSRPTDSKVQALLTMTLFALLALSVAADAVILQPPLGQYGVTRSTLDLTDTSRTNPFNNANTPRRLMLSVFEPTTPWKYCSKSTEPYMPPLAASTADQLDSAYSFPDGTFASVETTFCHAEGRVKGSNAQIIIFSHGLGSSRLIHSFQAISLASQG